VISGEEGVRYVAGDTVKTVSAGGEAVFTYTKEYLVTVDAEPRVEGFKVNGKACSLPCRIWVEADTTINLDVPSKVLRSRGSGMREYYVFSGWSDGYEEASRSIVVNRVLNFTAEYRILREFFVEVSAVLTEAEKGVHGGGWYVEGALANVYADEYVVVDDYRKIVFSGWSNGVSSRSLSFRVEEPVSLQARYVWLFRVEVESPFGEPFGAGWYSEGETANVGVKGLKDGYFYTSDDVRYRFVGWDVEVGVLQPGASPQLSFSVEGPLKLVAKFEGPEYRVCIDGECAFYMRGSRIPPRENVPLLDGLAVRVFIGYADSEGRIIGREIVVEKPMSVKAIYRNDFTGAIALTLVASLSISGYLLWKRRKIMRYTGESKTEK